MFKAMPRAATRESRPTIKPRPPKNSAAIARIASNAGICMVFVKKPMVPLKPSPPNQPNIFCAPCAKNTTPSANRRIAVAASFSVEMSFRNIVPPVLSLLLYAPFHEDCCRSPRSAGGNREHREAAPKAEAPGIHASRRSDRSAWLRRRSAAPRSRPTTFAAAPAAATRTTTRARSRRTRIEYRARDRLGRGRVFLCTRLVKKTFPEESTTRLPSCPSSALVAGPPSPAPPPVTVTPFCPSALREEQRTARHGQYYLKSAA